MKKAAPPAGAFPPSVCTRVQLHGLQARPELNGVCGRLNAFDAATGRYSVTPERFPMETILVRGENIRLPAEAPKASDIGPSAQCRHGGPPPDMAFINCMGPAIHHLQAATAAALRRARAGADDDVHAGELVSRAEVDSLWAFWTQHRGVIRGDSWKILFSMAVDAVIDSDFANARQFVRIGIFLRQWSLLGEAELRRRWAAGEVPEVLNCIHKTRTDRGIVLYLAEVVDCECLARHGTLPAMRALPKTGRCTNCERNADLKSVMRKCSGCRRVEYCSRDCQRQHWKFHKKHCRAWAEEEKNKGKGGGGGGGGGSGKKNKNSIPRFSDDT